MKLHHFATSVGNVASASVYLLSGSCVSASQSVLDPFFLSSKKVLKYADTNIIEFQSSRRNILKKIHTNIFVLKSSVLKCFLSC